MSLSKFFAESTIDFLLANVGCLKLFQGSGQRLFGFEIFALPTGTVDAIGRGARL